MSGRKQFPSMTALQVLLAVAERGSTSAAAEPVSLSQSAVSKQLLGLEELIGGPAFLRTPNGMVPTELGAIYIEHARTAIKAMEDAALKVARLKPGPRVLRLQVPPIFGDRWLLPRFAQFTEAHPEIEVQFTTFVSKTQTEVPDGMVRFVVKPVDDEQGDYLFGHDIRLVSAPSYWEKIGEPASIEAASKGVMLEHPQTPFHWPFFAAFHGEPTLAARHTMRFGYYTMVIRAALAGQGMALIPHGLIVEELATGRLVNPAGLGYRSDHGYWFTRPRNLPLSQSMTLFKRWIHTEAGSVRD
ncbi:LysR family transcriptional regulator (plasmid) [Aliirhizobium terrae]|nr:LysR family transcriptional regulator [Rhizobium sp. CC-CFT758]WJH37864.1 LysR family transcriptional regulator [Rhizobium sp. CC-CFT758]